MPSPRALTSPTVLVIDDSPDIRDLLALLLADAGYRVVTAASLARARVEIATRRPDVVVSEVRLADAPPFAVLDLLASEKTRDLPLVLCTGAVEEITLATADLAQRGATVVRKPFDIDDLLTAVRRSCAPACQPVG